MPILASIQSAQPPSQDAGVSVDFAFKLNCYMIRTSKEANLDLCRELSLPNERFGAQRQLLPKSWQSNL